MDDIHQVVQRQTTQGPLEVNLCKTYCSQMHGCPPGMTQMCYKDNLYEEEVAKNKAVIGTLTVEDCRKPPSASPIGTKGNSGLKYDMCNICKEKHKMPLSQSEATDTCFLETVRCFAEHVASSYNRSNSDSDSPAPDPTPFHNHIWGEQGTKSKIPDDLPSLLPDPQKPRRDPVGKPEATATSLTNGTADKNRSQIAESLIKEEEKEIKKKLKKKEKKKRRKAKKKEQERSKTSSVHDEDSSDNSDDDESHTNDEDILINSAFATATNKVNKRTSPPPENGPAVTKAPAVKPVIQTSTPSPVPEVREEEINVNMSSVSENEMLDRQIESRHIAKQGAEAFKLAVSYASEGKPIASRNMYAEALMAFNKAIHLYPLDCRYFANRSFVYRQMNDFESALRDAEASIKLDENFAKGYFRKGQALASLKVLEAFALKGFIVFSEWWAASWHLAFYVTKSDFLLKYDEAEDAYLKILVMDPDCIEAETEIRGLKLLRLIDMGFPEDDCKRALEVNGDVFEDALNSLLSKPHMPTTTQVKIPPTLPVVTAAPPGAVEIIQISSAKVVVLRDSAVVDPLEDHTNPAGCKTIWVGNLIDPSQQDEKKIKALFSKYGTIDSVFLKKESKCAFVNFTDAKGPGAAMRDMQGYKFGSTLLKIRYPTNNSSATTQNKPNLVLQKGAVAIGTKTAVKPTLNAVPVRPAIVNKNPELFRTTDCRHWKLGYCPYGDVCFFKHVQELKGSEKK